MRAQCKDSPIHVYDLMTAGETRIWIFWFFSFLDFKAFWCFHFSLALLKIFEPWNAFVGGQFWQELLGAQITKPSLMAVCKFSI